MQISVGWSPFPTMGGLERHLGDHRMWVFDIRGICEDDLGLGRDWGIIYWTIQLSSTGGFEGSWTGLLLRTSLIYKWLFFPKPWWWASRSAITCWGHQFEEIRTDISTSALEMKEQNLRPQLDILDIPRYLIQYAEYAAEPETSKPDASIRKIIPTWTPTNRL